MFMAWGEEALGLISACNCLSQRGMLEQPLVCGHCAVLLAFYSLPPLPVTGSHAGSCPPSSARAVP